MNLRQQADGSLLAPRRGKPPACPAGFERDPKDQFRFLPILVECIHRSTKDAKCKSCGSDSMFCKYAEITITMKTCVVCEGKPNDYFSN